MGNSMPASSQYSATSAAGQYSSSPGAAGSAYTNLHYVNANVAGAASQRVQYKSGNSSKPAPSCPDFPELDNMTNDELRRLGEDEDLMDEFLEKHTRIREVDEAVEEAIDWVEKTASKFFFFFLFLVAVCMLVGLDTCYYKCHQEEHW